MRTSISDRIWIRLKRRREEHSMFKAKEGYTPAEAKRANDELDRLVAAKTLTSRQAGGHRRQVARRTRLRLKASYSAAAAKRAKAEVLKLVEAGAMAAMTARAYRAHITKRTTPLVSK